jgi:nuclear transcription factor Y, gamma
VQLPDIVTPVARTEVFDFLVDVMPRNEAKDGEAATAAIRAGIPHPTTVTI